MSDYYSKWLSMGVHVVTPNKKAGSGELARWKECVGAMEATGAMWGDETTVGAGLPVLAALWFLKAAGQLDAPAGNAKEASAYST